MKWFLEISFIGAALITTAFSAHAGEKLSDAQVSKILTTSNDGEVLLAQYVMSHTKSSKVKAFAGHMLDDHTLNNTLNRHIASEERITPEDSAKSEELQKKELETQQKLMSLSGHDLDVAYMDDQVKTHETVLNDLTSTLIPSAKDPELRAHLSKTAEKVRMHLQHAKQVREAL